MPRRAASTPARLVNTRRSSGPRARIAATRAVSSASGSIFTDGSSMTVRSRARSSRASGALSSSARVRMTTVPLGMDSTLELPRREARAFLGIGPARRGPSELAVSCQHRVEDDRFSFETAERAEGEVTARTEEREERALRGDGKPRLAIVERARDAGAQARVIRPHLHRQRALPGRGRELVRIERFLLRDRDPEPTQSGHREGDRVVRAVLDLSKARVDVPTNLASDHIGTKRAEERGAPGARRPDDG